MTEIRDLPEEMLGIIFSFLSPADLKTVVLVSKQWMVVGENPTMWTWATVTVKNTEVLQKLKKRRFQKLQKIKVTNWFDERSQSTLEQSIAVRPEELFNALDPITTLSSIEGLGGYSRDFDYRILDFNLDGIQPELFARVLSRLSYLSFSLDSPPTPPQYKALLSSIAQKDSCVKKLVFDIHRVFAQPDLFAAAVSNVEECDFGTCAVPSQDMQALCATIAAGKGQLKKLRVYRAFLGEIEPVLLGTVISRLETVQIFQESDKLSKEQINSILLMASKDCSKLKMLEIIMIDWQKEEVNQVLLDQAGQKIGNVKWRAVSGLQVLTISAGSGD